MFVINNKLFLQKVVMKLCIQKLFTNIDNKDYLKKWLTKIVNEILLTMLFTKHFI